MASSRRRQNGMFEAVEVSSLLVGSMFLVLLLDWLLPLDLRMFGIVPRTLRGLFGILVSPLLHLGLAHLTANALPLLVLLILLFGQHPYAPERTLAWVWLGSGLGTWLIGRGGAIHIGASSIIYGLAAYLIATGWWLRSWRSILVAVMVLVLYGGAFYGLLPQRGTVSWEGHMAGAMAGFLVARQTHRRGA